VSLAVIGILRRGRNVANDVYVEQKKVSI